MSLLSARDLSKAYGPRTLFAGASLAIQPKERVGLLGPNGMGKSSLLRVLAGVEPPDGGVIEKKRGASILYLPQEPRLPPEATPRSVVEEGLREWHAASTRHAQVSAEIARGHAPEALLAEQAQLAETIERLGGWEQGHRASGMLERLGIREPDRALGQMSGGEQRRVALARILVAEPALAILDEPTNHLDVETIEYLEEYLAERFSGAVLLVTHDRYVLDAVADRILELEHGVLTEYRGGYFDYLEQKAERLAHAERREQNRQNLLRRERAWLLRGAKARTTKQKARIQRAQALMAIEAPQSAARVELRELEAGADQSGKLILELDEVGLELGARCLIQSLSLHLVQGDRIGIVGPNGAGKTSLLRLVAGELEPTRGRVKRGVRTKIAYFEQARAGLRDDWSVIDNVAEREGAERDGGGQVRLGELQLSLRVYLERFLFDGAKQRQKVASLSGGERARVALAKALRSGANLLLLDEPTNDLDTATLAELEELLSAWPGCALIVSHDRAFLDRVATSILAFEPGGSLVRYVGDYRAYREKIAARSSAQPEPAAARADKKPATSSARAALPGADVAREARPLSYAERLELEGLLDRVAAAEQTLAAAETALSDPASYAAGGERQRQLQAEYEAARALVGSLTARWEELETRSSAQAGRRAR